MPLATPLEGFAIAFAVLLVLAFRGARAYTAIAGMVLAYLLLASTPSQGLGALEALASWNDARVFVYIFLAMLLAGLMRELGLLDEMVRGLASSSCRLALAGVPALIGLMPMPGGALVSAIALRDKFEESGLTWEEATFINYWFRHVWVPSWPLFQSVVITAAVLYTSPLEIVSHTWPATLAAIAAGALVGAGSLARARCGGGGGRRGLLAIAPLVGLAILFLAGIPMLAALLLIVLLVAVFWRPSRGQLAGALRLATRPTIHLVLFESLYFKNLLVETGLGSQLVGTAEGLGFPPVLLAILVPFTLGLAAGGENFFASTAMPALAPLLVSDPGGINWWLASVAYASGYLGVMASPVHLCLALTLEYYNARTGPVLARVYAAVAIALLASIGLIASIH